MTESTHPAYSSGPHMRGYLVDLSAVVILRRDGLSSDVSTPMTRTFHPAVASADFRVGRTS